MPMTLKELYAETRRLPREQAAELMDLLLIDTFREPDPAVEETWGREVSVPRAVIDGLDEHAPLQTEGCLARRRMTVPLPLAQWKKLGVKTIAGGTLPTADIEASLVQGVKRYFLVYPNYQAVLDYNCVHAYGLSVGLLGDRAMADPPKAAAKPAKKTPAKKTPVPKRR